MVQSAHSGTKFLETPIPGDRAEELIARHIVQDRRHPGRHEAQIETPSSRPKVWAMVRYLPAADADEVARAYEISPEAMEAIAAYYQRHRTLIDAKIMLENEEGAAWDASLTDTPVVASMPFSSDDEPPVIPRPIAMQTAPTTSETNDLIERYIQADPDGFGADRARVVGGDAAVPVWALVGHMRGNSPRQTASDYALPEEAVMAALAFYRRHQAIIDARLTLNDAFFES